MFMIRVMQALLVESELQVPQDPRDLVEMLAQLEPLERKDQMEREDLKETQDIKEKM